MKDLKAKIKARISEMLDAEGLTPEGLGYLTSATCILDENERKKSMSALPMMAAGMALGRMQTGKDEDED